MCILFFRLTAVAVGVVATLTVSEKETDSVGVGGSTVSVVGSAEETEPVVAWKRKSRNGNMSDDSLIWSTIEKQYKNKTFPLVTSVIFDILFFL